MPSIGDCQYQLALSHQFEWLHMKHSKKTMEWNKIDAFIRVYLAPGIAHGGSGEDSDNLDLVTPAVAWVEHGSKTDLVVTHHVNATSKLVTASRPLFSYPAVAKYSGTGNPTAATNRSPDTALHTA